MSPEQAADSRRLDARTDLCSLGAVGYFILAGRPPFVRDTVMQVFAAHMYDPVEPLRQLRPDVPGDLEAVLMRCLEKDPEKRYADARSLEKALAHCRDAGAWTQEEAAAWWEQHGVKGETLAPGDAPTVELDGRGRGR
jgi:serine/threonine-protein kinase